MSENGKDTAIVVIIFLASFSSFFLGRMSALNEKTKESGVIISYSDNYASSVADTALKALKDSKAGQKEGILSQSITASKNGTKYYIKGCSNARIKEENKIYFNTEEEAQSAGYEKSLTCK